MTTSDDKTSCTERFRELFRFGFNPTATRAAMLLRISTQRFAGSHNQSESNNITNDYHLCVFTTEDVLSFCVDVTQVLVVDVSDKDSDFSSSNAPTTCLVVDDDPGCSSSLATLAWDQTTSPPTHFIFASMRYHRALDWFQKQMKRLPDEARLSVDMYNTFSSERGTLNCIRDSKIVELTLPCTVAATSIAEDFLQCCTQLTYLDMKSLTNVATVPNNFLCGCSALALVDLSSLTNVHSVGMCFLRACSTLTSVDLSPLANVSRIPDHFLDCSSVSSVDLSPLTNVSEIGCDFLSGCEALTMLTLSPLASVSCIGDFFLSGCSALTSVDLS
eukprot:PhM_4_TR12020/c0_g1_i1/m.48502